MQTTFKRIRIGVVVLIVLLIVLLLGLAIFHRISLRFEQVQLIPPGHMVEVNGEMMHIYLAGENAEVPLLVFLPSAGRFAPVYNFRPLYTLLMDYYRIAVIDRFGYGYSDFTDASRDIDAVVLEIRTALSYLGETGPFVLLPHSISGLEAMRWAQLYPEEIAAIIGINMAPPALFLDDHIPEGFPTSHIFASRIGIQRLPFFNALFYPYPVDEYTLTQAEHNQQRLLINRNFANKTVVAERVAAIPNSQTILDEGLPSVSTLLLVSRWAPYKEMFAREIDAQIIFFDSGHSLHQYEPNRVADLVRMFISELQK